MRTPEMAALRRVIQLTQIKTKFFLSATTKKLQELTDSKLVFRWQQKFGRLILRFSHTARRTGQRLVGQSKRLISQFNYRQMFEPFTGLIMIAAFVVVGNSANHQALAAPSIWESDVAGLSAAQVEQVLAGIDPLTPGLDEDTERIASLLLANDEVYLSRPDLAQMTEAETLSKKDPIPYVVQKGDTLFSIAKANNRTVATILEANGIKPEDAGKITPGVTLLIPQEDTSHSLAWLEADQRARAEAARVAAERAAKARAAKVAARNRALAAASSREISNEGFSGESSDGFIVPIRHKGISRGLSRDHTGIDYRADIGTPVVAAADGRVIEITRGWAGGWGISVVLDHGRGRTSRYAHLSSTAVQLGEVVSQGQTVGYSGSTGRSTGPHLHFEVRVGGRAVNPF